MISPTVNWIYPEELAQQLGPGDWPSFSPNGDQVVFVVGHGSYKLYTVGATGGTPTQIYPPPGATGVHGSRPDWSWNPNQIAFAQEDATRGYAEIWTVSPNGATAGPYNPSVPDLGDLIYPSWSKDLQSLVAVGYTYPSGATQASLYQLYGTGPTAYTQITVSPNPVAGRPSTGPTSLVAFAGNEGFYAQELNQIWIVDSAAGPSAHLAEVPPAGPSGPDLAAIQGRSPNWSPDGNWILFESTRPAPDPNNAKLAIWVMPQDGATAHPVISFPEVSISHAEWSREQDQIVFASGGRIGVMAFSATGQAG
jgi:Tol biopolymer transport system component